MARLTWTRGNVPDRTPRLPITIFNVPTGEPVNVRFLGSPYCTLVHGHNRRSYPCVRPEHTCPFCEQHAELIPAGYAAAQWWGPDANGKERWITCVCSLTDHALEVMRGKDLRGCVYTLKRSSGAYNAMLLSKFLETKLIGLPDEFDPIPVVERAWLNYLATFKTKTTEPVVAPPTAEASAVRELLGQLGNGMAEDVDQADQARYGKGGA